MRFPAATPPEHEDAGCSGGESFALRVLGDDMAPEFNEGDIIIIEPDGALKDGSFVLAQPAPANGPSASWRSAAAAGGCTP